MALHRTSRLSVRASPAELEHWNHIAHQHGYATTSHWIRVLLSSAELAGHDGSRVSDELREIRCQLSRAGNNLNQLAHSAHCGDAVHCGAVLEDLETLIRQCDARLSRSGRASARRRCERSAVILH
ncbi:MobC family plasmid mobilization relaxosome protein [Acetobacter thailandicus]|uniref:MobC family plasmid mobilization relaxosome protein n=1 Tax=Acetobacter thailandicus TaxID=1502842 RepID=A0ABT3QCI2_9PROT|nr:MobC family plasmid mobilization relaxosome protein [Acetobacter thailandicus]MCX2562986.1 MobC family plasmid mobilization relaxosome protein [Acetobacter thailandicus]NHN96221.1 plasmid mobilization relaxosome protein MobC [Acetobacter thailandicus]